MTTSETLEEKLRNQFNSIQAVGQISTAAGEELLNTSGDRELRLQSSLLIDAFGKVDRLSQSLKLGSIQQVIFNRSANSVSSSVVPSETVSARTRNADSVVQSKVILHNKPRRSHASDEEDDDEYDDEENFVFTSTLAPNLQNALLGDVIIRKTTERALVG